MVHLNTGDNDLQTVAKIVAMDGPRFQASFTDHDPSLYRLVCNKRAIGLIRINHLEFSLHNYSFLFLTPGQLVDIRDCEFLESRTLSFKDIFLAGYYSDPNFIFKFNFLHQIISPVELHLEKSKFAPMYDLANEIHWEIHKQASGGEHMLRSLLYLYLADINHYYSLANNFRDAVIDNPRILALKRILERDIQSVYSVQDLAKKLGISKTYLNRISLAYFGTSSDKLIRERRLQEVRKEILFTTKEINQIAADYNFSDPGNFNRFFKRETGATPLSYRHQFLK